VAQVADGLPEGRGVLRLGQPEGPVQGMEGPALGLHPVPPHPDAPEGGGHPALLQALAGALRSPPWPAGPRPAGPPGTAPWPPPAPRGYGLLEGHRIDGLIHRHPQTTLTSGTRLTSCWSQVWVSLRALLVDSSEARAAVRGTHPSDPGSLTEVAHVCTLKYTMAGERRTGVRAERRTPAGSGAKSPATSRAASQTDSRISASEHVYRGIKEAILDGTLPADSRLVEVSLAGEFGVSRTPVREALKRLAAEGLVFLHPARGMAVKGFTQSEVEDFYTIREVLDGLAARLAAQRVSDGSVTRLKVLLRIMAEATERGEQDRLVQANVHFHQVIFQATRNEQLIALGQSLADSLQRLSSRAFRSAERDAEVLEEHGAVVQALERRDPDAAEHAARRHMQRAREFSASASLDAVLAGEAGA
jgi:DNA-binding GntR family transcriptional regulator